MLQHNIHKIIFQKFPKKATVHILKIWYTNKTENAYTTIIKNPATSLTNIKNGQ